MTLGIRIASACGGHLPPAQPGECDNLGPSFFDDLTGFQVHATRNFGTAALVTGEKDGVVGHSVVIHAKEDDLKTDPAGASGDRIAGGVIMIKKAEK